MDVDRAFEVDFVFEPRKAASPEPFYVIVDAIGDEFIVDFLKAARAPGQFLGKISHPSDASDPDADIFVDPVTWLTHSETLYVEGARIRVLMYFNEDPTAYFDFAKACGPALGDLIHQGRMTPAALKELTYYLENWAMSRTVSGRVLPYTYYHVRDYAGLIAANAAKISKVFSVLADDESRTDYSRLLYGTNEHYIDAFAKKVFGFQQYNEIVTIRPGSNVINIGVGSGNEAWYFLAKMKGQGRVFNFDPMLNFDNAFAKPYEKFHPFFSNHYVLLGNIDGEVSAGIGMWGMVYTGHGLNKSADVQFQACRIDTLFAQGKIPRFHYVKMDVEGAELDILKGGIEAIKTCRPMLAVTIYHEAEHFWDFPLYLIEQLENYRFYVRQYGYSRFEALLYAVPTEDVGSLSGHEVPQLHPHLGADSKRTGIRTYLRDVEPRKGFNGQTINALTRAQGSSWETADIRPGPEVQTKEVLAIIEAEDASTVITRHWQDAARVISVGHFADSTSLTWIAQHSASDRDFVPLFGTVAGGPLYAEHDRADGKIYTVTVDGPKFDWFLYGYEQRRILALSINPEMPGLLVTEEDGSALWINSESETRLDLPGTIETVTTAISINDSGLSYTPGLVMGGGDSKGRRIYPLLPNGTLGLPMPLDVPGLSVIPTLVARRPSGSAAAPDTIEP